MECLHGLAQQHLPGVVVAAVVAVVVVAVAVVVFEVVIMLGFLARPVAAVFFVAAAVAVPF